MQEIVDYIHANDISNVTAATLQPLWGSDPCVGVTLGGKVRTHQLLPVSAYYEEIFNDKVTNKLVALLNAAKQRHQDDFSRSYHRSAHAAITSEELHRYHATELLISLENSTAEKQLNNGIAGRMSFNRFKFIRSLIGRISPQDIRAVVDSLAASFRSRWTPSNVVALDELLASYSSSQAEYCRFIPRKPHPFGHLFYLMVDKFSVGEDSYYYCYDIYVDGVQDLRSPTQAAMNMLRRCFVRQGQWHRVPLTVMDSAFNTTELLEWMQREKLFYLVGGLPSGPELASLCHQSFTGDPDTHVLFSDRFGRIVSTYFADKSGASEPEIIKVSTATNAFSTGSISCACSTKWPRSEAEELNRLSEAALVLLAQRLGIVQRSKAAIIEVITQRDLSKSDEADCSTCFEKKRKFVADSGSYTLELSARQNELQSLRVVELKDLCFKLQVGSSGTKAELVSRIASAEILQTGSEREMKGFIQDQFSCVRSGRGLVCEFYKSHFSKVDKFNSLFYRMRPPVTKKNEMTRMYLDAVFVGVLNAYAMWSTENHKHLKTTTKLQMENVVKVLIDEIFDKY
jgi:hypothetical protein